LSDTSRQRRLSSFLLDRQSGTTRLRHTGTSENNAEHCQRCTHRL